MSLEIEVLTRLDHGRHLVVEKATNEVWTLGDLLWEAGEQLHFREVDHLAPAGAGCAVTGPYPACLQMWGAGVEYQRYEPVGQTRHFLIFRKPGQI